MVTHLYFDFFGTLVYFQPEIQKITPSRTLNRLQLMGSPIDSSSFLKLFEQVMTTLEEKANLDFIEYSMEEKFEIILKELRITNFHQQVLTEIGWDFCLDWSDSVSYIPDIAKFITDLAKQYRLSIVSNTNSKFLVKHHLKQMGLLQHFNNIVLSIEHGRRKPCTTIFKAALDFDGVSSERSIFIGDSFEADYKGASAVGMKPILIDSKNKWSAQTNLRVQHLFDIRKYI